MSREKHSVELASAKPSTYYQKLFPYLQVQPCPEVDVDDQHNNFYSPSDSIKKTPLYQRLSKARVDGNRDKMHKIAVEFINSKQFIRSPGLLSPPFQQFLGFAMNNIRHPVTSVQDIEYFIADHLNGSEELKKYFNSSAFKIELNNLWLSVISLLVELDYQIHWLEKLLRLLNCLNLISLVVYFPDSQQVPSPAVVRCWAKASLLLPDDLFPMPSSMQAHDETNDQVKPYALGTLFMVNYRLSGYELGEIHRVENILKGETREASTRQKSNTNAETGQTNSLDSDQEKHQQQGDKDLALEVQKTLLDRTTKNDISNYQTDYKPTSPMSTTNGSWTVTESPAGGFSQGDSRFAREILTETCDRVTDKVHNSRKLITSDSTEQFNSTRFQNPSDSRNINGFYHWLNKVYDVQAIESERRFMLELCFDMPADELQELLDYECTQAPEEPISLADAGILGYEDILTAPPGEQPGAEANDQHHPTYYLTLCQQYDTRDVQPPPPPFRYISTSVRSDASTGNLNLPVPEGYEATEVSIIYDSLNASQQKAVIQVGTQKIDQPTTVLDEKLQGIIPVTIQTQPQENTPTGYLLNIVVKAERQPETLNLWQYTLFQQLKSSYQEQLKDYQKQLDEQQQWLHRNNNNITRTLVNRQLIIQSMKAIYRHALATVDDDPAVPLHEQPYMQYCEQSIDWDHMYCKLIYSEDSTQENTIKTLPVLAELDSQLYLKRFLLSKRVRVLVPVTRGYEQAVMYFIDTGRIWHGGNDIAPVNKPSLALVNDLKKLNPDGDDKETDTWKVSLPTVMTVLNDSDNIPQLKN